MFALFTEDRIVCDTFLALLTIPGIIEVILKDNVKYVALSVDRAGNWEREREQGST